MGKNQKNKIIAIVGATGSGKTGLAVQLALKFGGEIVSADSRQVYRQMDIGTGKDLAEYRFRLTGQKLKLAQKHGFLVQKSRGDLYCNIPYHCIDVASPKTQYDLLRWRKKAQSAIKDILARKRLPIVAGGTGLYVQALLDGYELSMAAPDRGLRVKLEALDTKELLLHLKKLDSGKFASLNNSEKNNKRRLIRYIEILRADQTLAPAVRPPDYDSLVLGVECLREELKERISKRLRHRLEKEDMIGEVERLRMEHQVSFKRLINFGLEYKFIAYYLQGLMGYQEMAEKLNIAIRQFAKRQMTWYRRWEKQGQKICWVKDSKQAAARVEEFLA